MHSLPQTPPLGAVFLAAVVAWPVARRRTWSTGEVSMLSQEERHRIVEETIKFKAADANGDGALDSTC